MTDYNDGNWHGWNGGECPVHPKSLVTALEGNGARWTANAEDCDWPSMKGAFRVTKAYLEPREWWLCGRNFFATEMDALQWSATMHPDHSGVIRVIEVLP